MFARLPDWRWREIQKAIEKKLPPVDSFMREVYDVIVEELDRPIIQRALELYATPEYRDSIISFFLSGAELEQIFEGIQVPVEELIAFEQLFIDTSVFRNRLEWRAYAKYYAKELAGSEDGRAEVESGVLYGPFILQDHWRMGNQVINVPTNIVVADSIMLAHKNAIAARSTSLLDPASKEALKWSAAALRGVAARDNLKTNNELDSDARAAILQRKATMTADEAGLDLAEILH